MIYFRPVWILSLENRPRFWRKWGREGTKKIPKPKVPKQKSSQRLQIKSHQLREEIPKMSKCCFNMFSDVFLITWYEFLCVVIRFPQRRTRKRMMCPLRCRQQIPKMFQRWSNILREIALNQVLSSYKKWCFSAEKKPSAGLHQTGDRAGDAPKPPFPAKPIENQ